MHVLYVHFLKSDVLSLGSYCGFLLDHGNGTVTWLYLNVFYCVHTTWDVVIIINRQITIQWNPSKTPLGPKILSSI